MNRIRLQELVRALARENVDFVGLATAEEVRWLFAHIHEVSEWVRNEQRLDELFGRELPRKFPPRLEVL